MIKSKIMSIVLAGVIFVVGVFCGLFLDRLIPSYRMYPGIPRGNKYYEGKILDGLSSRFSKNLNLTEEQREKLSQILDKHKEAMEKLRKDIRPKFEELRNSMKEEIKSIFNDKQKEKFDRMTEEREKRGKRRKRFKTE